MPRSFTAQLCACTMNLSVWTRFQNVIIPTCSLIISCVCHFIVVCECVEFPYYLFIVREFWLNYIHNHSLDSRVLSYEHHRQSVSLLHFRECIRCPGDSIHNNTKISAANEEMAATNYQLECEWRLKIPSIRVFSLYNWNPNIF